MTLRLRSHSSLSLRAHPSESKTGRDVFKSLKFSNQCYYLARTEPAEVLTFPQNLINKDLIKQQNKMTVATLYFDALDTQRKTAWIVRNEEDDEIGRPDEDVESELDGEEEDVTGELELNEEFDEVKENILDQDEEDKVDGFFEVEK